MGKTSLRLLGGRPARLHVGDEVFAIGRKALALICYLALHPEMAVSRDELSELLWPERFQEQARHSLRQALLELRRVPPLASALRVEPDAVAFSPATLDVDALQLRALTEARRPEDAAARYEGDLLVGFRSGSDRFDRWLEHTRRELRSVAASALIEAATAALEADQLDAALAHAARALAIEPSREAAHRIAMTAHQRAGRRADALRQYELCEEAMQRELGAVPSAEMRAMRDALRGTAPDERPPLPLPDKPSVAVLPFSNLGLVDADEHVIDALTDEVIAALGRFRWLFVIGRNSSFAFKGRSVDVSTVSRELGVRYVISGSARRVGERVRILAELVDAPLRRVVWSEPREWRLSDLPDTLEDLTRAIVAAIEPEILAAEGERAAAKPLANLDAWERAARAQLLLHRGERGDVMHADALAAEAISLDPESPHGWKMRAYCHYTIAMNFWDGNPETWKESSLAAALRAVALDERDAESRYVLGRVYTELGRNEDALRELRHALEMNPNAPAAYIHLAICLSSIGKAREAIELYAIARRLSPLDRRAPFWFCAEAFSHFMAGSYGEAIRCAERSSASTQRWLLSKVYLAAGHALLGDLAAAASWRDKMLEISPDVTIESLVDFHHLELAEDRARLAEGLRLAGVPSRAVTRGE